MDQAAAFREANGQATNVFQCFFGYSADRRASYDRVGTGRAARLHAMTSTITRNVLHIHSSPVILDLIRAELTAGWAGPIAVLSFSDALEAARQVLYGAGLRLDLAVLDTSGQSPVDTRSLVGLLRDCHPFCPAILTNYPEAPVSEGIMQMGNIHLLESPFSGAQFRELAGRLLDAV